MARHSAHAKSAPLVNPALPDEHARSRSAVAAPGKTHRPPTPPEHLDPHLGEVQGRTVGQKNMKAAWRGGRMH